MSTRMTDAEDLENRLDAALMALRALWEWQRGVQELPPDELCALVKPFIQDTKVANLKDVGLDGPDCVYIGRGSPFGNPFRVNAGGRSQAIGLYREVFMDRVQTEPEFRRKVLGLRGKTLVCHCKPLDCHGDVIVEWLSKNSA